eukprot:TRINITY_DN106049_c0_g1_i1.p2 TRINITY_DN106049_c0_g1~~TRINITY_DN106049_c0_g1_i1.p2  ORF type:complete len:126 (-),score=29.34 TRINITY_DN106049_c0_g1_i1:78-455(-)
MDSRMVPRVALEDHTPASSVLFDVLSLEGYGRPSRRSQRSKFSSSSLKMYAQQLKMKMPAAPKDEASTPDRMSTRSSDDNDTVIEQEMSTTTASASTTQDQLCSEEEELSSTGECERFSFGIRMA